MLDKNMYKFEREYWKKKSLICGVDEVGRGCLAGPIVTCAAMLHPKTEHKLIIDSKKLQTRKLLEIYKWLISRCTYSIGINSPRIIDEHNIYKATSITMKSSILNLCSQTIQPPSLILIDAMPITLVNTPYNNIEIQSFTKGEEKSASIAAASIIAKVTRDAILQRLNNSFPSYGFLNHKGYATPIHKNSLRSLQASIIHRSSYLKKFETEMHHGQQSLFC